MAVSFFLSLREGLEAALILGVLLGVLRKLNRQRLRNLVWYGASAAAAASIFVGMVLNTIGATFSGKTEEIFEGSVMLLAAGILTWTVLWMQVQSKTITTKLETDVQNAVLRDSKTALFTLAFISVFREGVELAIFLTAASVSAGNTQIFMGAILGLAVVVIIAVLLFQSLIHLNISRFFQITSIMLIVFAAGLVAHGVHELNEAGIIPAIIEHIWDINFILDEKSMIGEMLKVLVGYNGNPSLSEVISYISYLFLIFILVKKTPDRAVNTRSYSVDEA